MKWERYIVIGCLASVVAGNAIMLWPEVSINRHPLNDIPFHYSASLAQYKNLSLDGWYSSCCMGWPLWTVYQPIPHMVTGVLMKVLPLPPLTTFVWIHYILLCILPIGFYLLARALGLGQVGSVASAFLCYMPGEGGQYGRFGISYGAYVWRGSGMYSQLWGFIVGIPTLAYGIWAFRRGKGFILTGILLSLAVLSHLVVGYIVVMTLCLLVLLGCVGSGVLWERVKKLSLVGLIGVMLTSWFFIPLLQDWKWINPGNGVWDEKWRGESFGAVHIVTEIVNGTLLDGGRLPILTFLMLVGIVVAIKLRDKVGISLVAILGYWILMWFGPTTWGKLAMLFGVPWGIQPHRFQLGFEVGAVLIAAYTIERGVRYGLEHLE